MKRSFLLLFLALTGCIFGSSALDADGDGAPSTLDCDDANASVFPRAPELCDGIDNDCDGVADDSIEDAPVWYTDADADGFGAATSAVTSCTRPPDTVTNGADCDDTNPSLHPSAVEACNAIDDDCDGAVDDDLPTDWFLDADGDGYGADSQPGPATCAAPDGYVARGGDCDDARADVHPMATEADCGFDATDVNCDGSVGYADLDGDGVAACAGDCDDGDALRSPALPERCDADDLDEDCDGASDDLDAGGALDTVAWAADADGDGFGGTTRVDACDAAVGRIAVGGEVDCNDEDPLVSPAATEACDPARIDDDCDGYADEDDPDGAAGMGTRWHDDDGDGQGAGASFLTCASAPGSAGDARDCDDSDATVYAGASEGIADGIDQDCDGTEVCYVDADGDGYGATLTTSPSLLCSATGLTRRSGDCDDTTSAVRPRALELVADGVDSDCDGYEICYVDADGDGFGDASHAYVSSADVSCTGANTSSNALDCNDANALAHPGAAELVADGVDEDCDGRETCYVDSDRDGYGSSRTTTNSTLSCAVSGVSTLTGDCYDSGGATAMRVYPGAAYAESSTACMEDKDRDGYGDETPSAGGIVPGTDCHDSVAYVYPGAAYLEAPSACMEDADGDGWGDRSPSASAITRGTDCDDTYDQTYPGAMEVCDGLDNNCDGLTDGGGCVAM